MATYIWEKIVKGNRSKTSCHRATDEVTAGFIAVSAPALISQDTCKSSGIAIGFMILCVKETMCWTIYFYWKSMF
jgi:hypothetical protein